MERDIEDCIGNETVTMTQDLSGFLWPRVPAGSIESFNLTITPSYGEPLNQTWSQELSTTVGLLIDNDVYLYGDQGDANARPKTITVDGERWVELDFYNKGNSQVSVSASIIRTDSREYCGEIMPSETILEPTHYHIDAWGPPHVFWMNLTELATDPIQCQVMMEVQSTQPDAPEPYIVDGLEFTLMPTKTGEGEVASTPSVPAVIVVGALLLMASRRR